MKTFYPSKPYKTNVEKWVYSKNNGLKVKYKNDSKLYKSWWTLKELLNATHLAGDGLPAITKKQED